MNPKGLLAYTEEQTMGYYSELNESSTQKYTLYFLNKHAISMQAYKAVRC
jgi:hypothetical protein